MAFTLGLVDDFDSLRGDDQPFRIHLVLGKVFHIHLAEITDAHVLRDEGFVYVLENHHVEQFAAEMQTGCWSRYGAFVSGEYGLVIHLVLRRGFLLHPFRDRSLAQ